VWQIEKSGRSASPSPRRGKVVEHLAKLNTPLCHKLPTARATHGTVISCPASAFGTGNRHTPYRGHSRRDRRPDQTGVPLQAERPALQSIRLDRDNRDSYRRSGRRVGREPDGSVGRYE
jgi:hypothetical protein